MRRFLWSLIIAVSMLTAMVGGAAAFHGETNAPNERDCLGAHVSTLAGDGEVGENVPGAATEMGRGFGELISGVATTCDFPPPPE